MTEFDPNEIVCFDGRRESLLRAVPEIMRQPPQRRTYIAVFRESGLQPPVFEIGDIEKMAGLPSFVVAG
jgi:hypothetical protein